MHRPDAADRQHCRGRDRLPGPCTGNRLVSRLGTWAAMVATSVVSGATTKARHHKRAARSVPPDWRSRSSTSNRARAPAARGARSVAFIDGDRSERSRGTGAPRTTVGADVPGRPGQCSTISNQPSPSSTSGRGRTTPFVERQQCRQQVCIHHATPGAALAVHAAGANSSAGGSTPAARRDAGNENQKCPSGIPPVRCGARQAARRSQGRH